MQERIPPHVALIRRISEHQSVDASKIGVAIARAYARSTKLPCMPLGEIDALRCIGVRSQKIETCVAGAADGPEIAVRAHRPEESGRREWVKSRLSAGANSDSVCFQFLITRKLRHLELAADNGRLGDRRASQNLLGDLTADGSLFFHTLTLDAMIGRDVSHLMRDDCRQFSRVIGERKQASRHVEITAWHGEGIDVGRIENGDAIGLTGIARNSREVADNLCNHAL